MAPMAIDLFGARVNPDQITMVKKSRSFGVLLGFWILGWLAVLWTLLHLAWVLVPGMVSPLAGAAGFPEAAELLADLSWGGSPRDTLEILAVAALPLIGIGLWILWCLGRLLSPWGWRVQVKLSNGRLKSRAMSRELAEAVTEAIEFVPRSPIGNFDGLKRRGVFDFGPGMIRRYVGREPGLQNMGRYDLPSRRYSPGGFPLYPELAPVFPLSLFLGCALALGSFLGPLLLYGFIHQAAMWGLGLSSLFPRSTAGGDILATGAILAAAYAIVFVGPYLLFLVLFRRTGMCLSAIEFDGSRVRRTAIATGGGVELAHLGVGFCELVERETGYRPYLQCQIVNLWPDAPNEEAFASRTFRLIPADTPAEPGAVSPADGSVPPLPSVS